jgi:hypothetical protein
MAFGVQRTATFHDKEILVYLPKDGVAIKNAYIDSTTLAAGSDGRYVLEAGQVMVKSTTHTGMVAPAAASGVLAADVVGILKFTLEFFYPVAAGQTDEPAGLYFEGVFFDTTKLVGYSGNATAVKTGLPLCQFI